MGATCDPINGASCEVGTFCNHGTLKCDSISNIVHGADGAMCNLQANPPLGCAGDLVCWSGQQTGMTGTCTKLIAEGKTCTGLGGVPCVPGSVCVRNPDNSGTCHSLSSCGAATCNSDSYCNFSATPPACTPRPTEGKVCNVNADTGAMPCAAGFTCSPLTATATANGVCMKEGTARSVTCTDTQMCPYLLKCVNGHCAPLDPASCN
jgi:hypothetical protein